MGASEHSGVHITVTLEERGSQLAKEFNASGRMRRAAIDEHLRGLNTQDSRDAVNKAIAQMTRAKGLELARICWDLLKYALNHLARLIQNSLCALHGLIHKWESCGD